MKHLKLFFVILILSAICISCDKDNNDSPLLDIIPDAAFNSGITSYTICIPPYPTTVDTTFANIDLSNNFDSILISQGLERFTISSVQLKTLDLTILTPTTANFDAINNFDAIISGTNLSTTKVASIDSIPAGTSSVSLIPSSAELVNYFQNGANPALDINGSTNAPTNDTLKVRVDVDLGITAVFTP